MSESFPEKDSIDIYFREIREGQILGHNEFNELIVKAKAGDKGAKEKCVRAQLRLVVYLAKRYRARARSLLLNDLIQEGNLGLLEAIERYDPERGFKFSTYASWWIRHHIMRAIGNTDSEVRIPIHLVDTLTKLRQLNIELEHSLQREASEEELMAYAVERGIPMGKVRKAIKASRIKPEKEPRNSKEEQTAFVEGLEDPDALAEEGLIYGLDMPKLEQMIESLSAREQEVLRQRLNGERTLSDIGNDYGLTRERIRQIEKGAFIKLRRYAHSGWEELA